MQLHLALIPERLHHHTKPFILLSNILDDSLAMLIIFNFFSMYFFVSSLFLDDGLTSPDFTYALTIV